MITRNQFEMVDVAVLVLDLNNPKQDHRHHIACQWCERSATGRWRRRIAERRGHAVLDRAIFEFELKADADACNDWLTARGWCSTRSPSRPTAG